MKDNYRKSETTLTTAFLWRWDGFGWAEWICENCGYTESHDTQDECGYNYCPECGAKVVRGRYNFAFPE